MSSTYQLVCVLVLLALACVAHAGSPAECDEWAEMGECDANPGYMLVHCKDSCKEQKRKENDALGGIGSFYDLTAKDIDGVDVDFDRFRGKATVVVNVASYCGYTEQHYRELVQLHRDLLKATEAVEIVAFPCNQFGEQEPEECPAIKDFARKKGVKFLMMDKVDVNGSEAHLVYKYLKKVAGPPRINWNFATYFVISPAGKVESHSGVTPSALYDLVLEMIDKEL